MRWTYRKCWRTGNAVEALAVWQPGAGVLAIAAGHAASRSNSSKAAGVSRMYADDEDDAARLEKESAGSERSMEPESWGS